MIFPGQVRGLPATEKVPEEPTAVRSPGRTWQQSGHFQFQRLWLAASLGRTRRVLPPRAQSSLYALFYRPSSSPT